MINDNSYLDKNGLILLLQDLSEKIRNKIGNSLTEDNRSKLATIGLIIDKLNDLNKTIEDNEEVVSAALNDLEKTKQDTIDSLHKLSADLILDGTTNKVYTSTEKSKLAGIADGAEVNVQPDWNAIEGDGVILNKPDIPIKVSDLENDVPYVTEEEMKVGEIDANGHEYVDMGLPSGTMWSPRNIGYTGSNSVGNYYSWGETIAKTINTLDNYEYYQDGAYVDIGENISKTLYDTAKAVWGGDWCMPTVLDLYELGKYSTVTISYSSIVFTSNINGHSISIPFSGYRSGGNIMYSTGSKKYAMFWYSNIHNETNAKCYGNSGSEYNSNISNLRRFIGIPVRPVLKPHLVDKYATKQELNTEILRAQAVEATKANIADLSTVATTGSYNDLTDKPTNISTFTNDSGYLTLHLDLSNYTTHQDVSLEIASLVNSAPTTLDTLNELAEALGNDPNFATTVASLIGAKYTKPTNGIPSTDLASDVQTSLGKANTALQSFTETDPTVPSHVKEITTTDISNWNSKQAAGNYVTTDTQQTITAQKTFNSRVNFLGSGDNNAIYLSTNTRIDVNGTSYTVLGFINGTFIINHTNYNLKLRGKGTRPVYNTDDNPLALLSDIPTNVSQLTNDAGYLTSYTETDPTVPAWAKASTKPTYTYSEVGAADKQLIFGTNFSQAPIFPYIHILSSGDILILNKFGYGLGETIYLRYDFPAMEVLYNQKMVRIAGINSPALEGTPTAPTAAAGTNNTQIATTEFVQNTVDSKIADIPDPVKPDWNATPGSTAEILNKPTIPAAQIQSDWNLTTTTSLDYIKNKPNIPITDYDIYAANLLVTNSANYITEPEVKSVKINGSSTNSASSNNCVLLYDTTNKCLKFIFN